MNELNGFIIIIIFMYNFFKYITNISRMYIDIIINIINIIILINTFITIVIYLIFCC